MSNKKNAGDTYNVTSHGQSGGITAGVVNIGPQDRDLSVMPDVQKILLDNVSGFKSRSFRVQAQMGNPESYNFALQLQVFLRANGFVVEDFISEGAGGKPPPVSYHFEGEKDEKVVVVAGPNR